MENKRIREVYDIKSWQSHHINQLSYIRNTLIIVSTGLSAFLISLILKEDHYKLDLKDLKSTLITLGISTTVGLVMAMVESANYRIKYKIARKVADIDDPERIDKNTDFIILERKATNLESGNRMLFVIQLTTFLLSIITITIFVLKIK